MTIPGLYLGPGVYPGPGFYPRFYGIYVMHVPCICFHFDVRFLHSSSGFLFVVVSIFSWISASVADSIDWTIYIIVYGYVFPSVYM